MIIIKIVMEKYYMKSYHDIYTLTFFYRYEHSQNLPWNQNSPQQFHHKSFPDGKCHRKKILVFVFVKSISN